MLEFATLVERMKREPWRSVALDLGVDTTTPNGECVANVMGSFAQFERQMISVRTKEALVAARARGIRLGRRSALTDETRLLILRHHMSQGVQPPPGARYLEQTGVPAPNGGPRWQTSTITRLIAQSGGTLQRVAPPSS